MDRLIISDFECMSLSGEGMSWSLLLFPLGSKLFVLGSKLGKLELWSKDIFFGTGEMCIWEMFVVRDSPRGGGSTTSSIMLFAFGDRFGDRFGEGATCRVAVEEARVWFPTEELGWLLNTDDGGTTSTAGVTVEGFNDEDAGFNNEDAG